jgi:hypothetical protein
MNPNKIEVCEGVEIFDDYIPEVLIEAAYQECLSADRWKYLQSVTYNKVEEGNNDISDFGFIRFFYDAEKSIIEPEFKLLMTLPVFVGVSNMITRCKANLSFPVKDTEHRLYHTDTDNPNKVMIIYLNDSTGPTMIRTADAQFNVEPKKGRVILMDGNIEHAAGVPEDSARFVLNYNFEK